MSKKNMRRISCLVSSQTLFHLENMRQFCGYKDIGRVIDKLVREKQMSHHVTIEETEVRNRGTKERKSRSRDW